MTRKDAIDYPRAAQIYLDAVRDGIPPTQAVSTRLPCTYQAAGKVVMRARKAGLLPPAAPAGKPQTCGLTHFAVEATIGTRSRPNARVVKLCNHCITAWPCDSAQ